MRYLPILLIIAGCTVQPSPLPSVQKYGPSCEDRGFEQDSYAYYECIQIHQRAEKS